MARLHIFLSKDNPINFDLGEERATIGRLAHNMLQIDEVSVSSHHADIFLKEGRYHLQDTGSTNGTFVNGEQITNAVLRNGDEVRFGSVEGLFVSEEEAPLSQPRPDFLTTSLEVATSSVRPENFVSSSPSPKSARTSEPLGAVLYCLAALASLSFGAAVFCIFTM
ncbi:MAG TPA: FHA domain-containing protein [Terrimicrobiaceae bacterium]